MTSATRPWMFVPLCAALGCGSGPAAATAPPGPDAGFTAADGGAFLDSGTNPSPSIDGSKENTAAEGGTGSMGPDSGMMTCLPEESLCSDGGTPCCNGDCRPNGTCGGCLGEGESCTTPSHCCMGLSCTTSGFCGTAACVWEGKACGGDAGAVCCNDDCNASGFCGPS